MDHVTRFLTYPHKIFMQKQIFLEPTKLFCWISMKIWLNQTNFGWLKSIFFVEFTKYSDLVKTTKQFVRINQIFCWINQTKTTPLFFRYTYHYRDLLFSILINYLIFYQLFSAKFFLIFFSFVFNLQHCSTENNLCKLIEFTSVCPIFGVSVCLPSKYIKFAMREVHVFQRLLYRHRRLKDGHMWAHWALIFLFLVFSLDFPYPGNGKSHLTFIFAHMGHPNEITKSSLTAGIVCKCLWYLIYARDCCRWTITMEIDYYWSSDVNSSTVVTRWN